MTKNNIKSKKGFTIIEVVLVLAIAGLIFLMVFIALPALQTSQRDTQRRDDMARFASQLQNYSANNRGKVPGEREWGSFVSAYLAGKDGDDFVDPDGNNYTVEYVGSFGNNTAENKDLPFDHKIYVYQYAECDGENAVKSTGDRKIAFRYKLESAGIYCGTN